MRKSEAKKLLTTLGVLLFIGAYLFIFSPKSDREAYEDYLGNLYQKAQATSDSKIPGQPDQAYLQNFIQTLDPELKIVPEDALAKAMEQTKRLNNNQAVYSRQDADPFIWESIPASISGRVRAITFDPDATDPPQLWTGSVSGGLWFNSNADDVSSAWEPVETGIPNNMGIGAIAFDPIDSDVMYVGTGESYTAVNIYRESSAVGDGIWKSEDHGQTWTQLTSTSGFKYINDIIVKQEDNNSVIYAAMVSGTYKGATFGSNPTDGLYRSTDGGANWTQVLPNIPGENTPYAPSDIELTSSGRLFVGSMRNLDRKGAGTILYSDNGTDWSIYDELTRNTFDSDPDYYPGRVLIKSAPTDPDRIYAIISGGYEELETEWIRDEGSNSLIIQSFDAGENWSQIATPDEAHGTWSNITWHAAALTVDPTDANTLYIAAFNAFKMENTQNASLLSSADWVQLSNWTPATLPNYIHADQHEIHFDPTDPNRIFYSTDGGVFMSEQAQSNEPLFLDFNTGLNTLQYYTLALSPIAGDETLLAGTQDNGTLKFSNDRFDFVFGGDGAFCFIDQDDPNIQLVSAQYNYVVASWDAFVNRRGLLDQRGGLFINPSDYDSKNNILFTNTAQFGYNKSNPTTRPIARFSLFNNTYSTSTLDFSGEFTSPISNIKVSPFGESGESVLFIGTQSGRVYRVNQANTNNPDFTEITGGEFPTSNISSIDVGQNESELLVSFSNFGVNSVWYSSNGGSSWRSIEGDLPDMPVRWGIFDPIDSDEILLATELGVWSGKLSDGETPNWQQESLGFPDVRVDMIKARKNDGWLVAATHGRGIYTSELRSERIVASIPEETETSIKVYPNPASGFININFEGWATLPAEVVLMDAQGQSFINEEVKSSALQLDVAELPRGIYFINFIDDKTGMRKTQRVLLD